MKLITPKVITSFIIMLIYIPLSIWKYYNNENLQKILNKL